MCVGDWKYGGNVVLVNVSMEVLCVLVNGHMGVMWCWRMDIWRYCVCWCRDIWRFCVYW